MIINVSHYKGGTGKSTLSTNFSIALNAPILDLDGQESSVLFAKLRKMKGYEPVEVLTAKTEEEINAIFDEYAGDDKILVVDSGGFDSDVNRLAMIKADILITPVAPSQVELFGLQKYVAILKKISDTYGHTFRTNVVINNADVRSKGAIRELKKYISQNDTHLDLYSTVIHNRADYKKAYGEGVSTNELDANSKAAFEITQLVKEIQKDF